ncbi:MAG TPA: disulfide oxidoreductase [Anaerolineales bacterium]|nr:disulfide oxidoreductase [Anaerolineales bacterium]HRQ92490.1 disulfide oxidoreductase [Anaerolineales bacterium]
MSKLRSGAIYLAWFQALIATLGSLFFSEVMQLTPCMLCWYQRIFMYPLVAVLTVGILLRDANIKYYVLPLSLTGLAISMYHNLLYYGILAESMAPCTTGVSCTVRQIEWFGFITIPLMALTAFVVITFSLLIYKRGSQSHG